MSFHFFGASLHLAMVCVLALSAPVAATAADEAKPESTPDAAGSSSGQATEKDGQWQLPDGTPTYHIGKDNAVDWYTASGYLRYGANCAQCHGPDGLGSSYAPDLTASLKTMDYSTFVQTVSGGKQTKEGDTTFVMPSLGTDKNVMCYIDDIYTYLKARSDGAVDRGRPANNDKPSAFWEKAQDECMGP